jgi:phenylalanyl-tRNA synthetase beta subunit
MYNYEQPVYINEHQINKTGTFLPISNQPSIIMDLSLFVPRGILWSKVQSTIVKHAGKYLKKTTLLEYWTWENVTFSLKVNLPKNYVSMFIKIEYQALNSSLEREIINVFQENVRKELTKLGVTVR